LKKSERMKKIKGVGRDEFCMNCMEWREYDEEGKCKKCGKLIKKQSKNAHRDSYDEYKSEGPSYEMDEDTSNEEEY
jgi:hypothetical protein